MKNSAVLFKNQTLAKEILMPEPSLMQTLETKASGSYSYKLFQSVEALPTDWNAVAPTDFFLQKKYFEVLETLAPVGMRFAYLIFYKNESPIGIAPLQIKFFKADESIGDLNEPVKEQGVKCFFSAFSNFVKRKVASKVSADVLIVGNLLLTGEHGYYFDNNLIAPSKAMMLLDKACTDALPELRKNDVRMPVVFVKDVLPQREPERTYFTQNEYAEFEVQPNMELELPFDDFDAYLAAMGKKYRKRAKRAFKKFEAVEKRELNVEEIKAHHDHIYSLYFDIAKNAVFNMVELHSDYFWRMKELMPDRFTLTGYFLDGELIAYYTTINNGPEIEAHFLGYNKDINKTHLIYQNILYDLVRSAFNANCEKLVLGRTALEIKSAVGAAPVRMFSYLKHRNNIANRFTGTMLDYFNPVEVWEQRHPFKR